MPPPASHSAEIAQHLLEWYKAGHRDLPWRRTRDPYAIWVSEIMLQQTQVATVIPYYERFLQRFPTLQALAEAPEDEVLRLWAGLGYYSRARNLHRGAQEVLAWHGGRMPETVEELLRLPGIGRYTAGAIASIAFDRRAPILDGNVIRVLCRLYALRGDPKRSPLHARLWELAEALIPEGQAGAFNQAMMELGATVCTPASPRCELCPVAAHCEARRLGLQELLPELPRAAAPVPLRMAAAVVWRGAEVLLVKRAVTPRAEEGADRGWWTGLWQFPTGAVRDDETPATAAARLARELLGLDVSPRAMAGVVRHGVTRWKITLEAWHCEIEASPGAISPEPNAPSPHRVREPAVAYSPPLTEGLDWRWSSIADTTGLGLPAPQRRLVEQIERQRMSGTFQAAQQPLLEV